MTLEEFLDKTKSTHMVLKSNCHNILFAGLTYIQAITLRRQTSLTTNLQRNLYKKTNFFLRKCCFFCNCCVYCVSFLAISSYWKNLTSNRLLIQKICHIKEILRSCRRKMIVGRKKAAAILLLLIHQSRYFRALY